MASNPSMILEPAGAALRVDVVSDLVCPWCYVGKRQLEAALARWQAAHPDMPPPQVRWHPFQLNPDLPQEGMARTDYLQRKFGTPDPGAIYERVLAAARAVGLSLDVARIARQPNTLRAHALVAAAPDEATQQAVVERLFQAYFVEGADLGSQPVLAHLATEAGLAAGTAATAVEAAQLARVAEADTEARRLGVTGVPCFVIDGKLAVSGAQGAEALLSAFDQVRDPAG